MLEVEKSVEIFIETLNFYFLLDNEKTISLFRSEGKINEETRITFVDFSSQLSNVEYTFFPMLKRNEAYVAEGVRIYARSNRKIVIYETQEI